MAPDHRRSQSHFNFRCGGRNHYIFEHPILTGNAFRQVAWVRKPLDLAELARLRKSQEFTIPDLAKHFNVGTSAIKERLRKLQEL